jgi:alkanesulfonate monooxygenase SsuD/methylene tetrahydromethanopterin reductase-like flavin-dependent oxidoreductase (luciferase family)
MRFGLFYEHQVPRPWSPDSEQRVFREALEQIGYADRIGFDSVWLVEHHFLEEYSHSSAPEVFLAAVSQRTERIRLGHGIVQMPPAFNHPARVAERIATLDIVSGGRVELGTGESSSEAELGGFGIEPEHKRAMWEEGLRVTLRCLTETPFTGHAGDWVTMPPRNVVPKPVQRPHPPVWVACTRRETILLAARHGIGALTFTFQDPEETRHWVREYQETLAREGVPIGDAVNPRIAVVTPMSCHPDAEEAARRGSEGGNFLAYSLAHYYIFGRHRPGATDLWAEFQERRQAAGFDPEVVQRAAATPDRLGARVVTEEGGGLRGAIGTPAQIGDYLRRYEEAGVDLVILAATHGRTAHEHTMESLQRFAEEVMPEFADRDAARARAGDPALAATVDTVLARKPASDHPPLPHPDYEFPAIPRAIADRRRDDEFHARLDGIAARSALGDDQHVQGLGAPRRLG